MAKALSSVGPEAAKMDPVSATALMKEVVQLSAVLTSGTPIGTFAVNQLRKAVQDKMASEHSTFTGFFGASSSLSTKWLSASPTFGLVTTLLDRGQETGLLNDSMLLSLLDNPSIIGELLSEVASSL